MATLVTDPAIEKRLKAERQASGADRFDEVWEGIYMMAPMPNSEHQELVLRLAAVLLEVFDHPGLGRVFPGINISDRVDDWQQNYRVPDVAVFLSGNPARDFGAFWRGGPDLAVEIVSTGDRSREKLAFYQQVRTCEVLFVDRQPWRLELFRLTDDQLQSVGDADVQNGREVTSKLDLRFQLVAGQTRPTILIRREQRQWRI